MTPKCRHILHRLTRRITRRHEIAVEALFDRGKPTEQWKTIRFYLAPGDVGTITDDHGPVVDIYLVD